MYKKITSLALLFTGIFLFSCQEGGNEQSFTDPRDGNEYAYVQIGDQVWMAENLRYDSDQGYNRPYEDLDSNIALGYLYDWETACDVCPEGWHLPSRDEWEVLINSQGGYSAAAPRLRSASERWGEVLLDSTNASGFAAEPNGVLRYDDRFAYLDKYAYFWTSTTGNKEGEAWSIAMDGKQKHVHHISFRTDNSVSVRCLKD